MESEKDGGEKMERAKQGRQSGEREKWRREI